MWKYTHIIISICCILIFLCIGALIWKYRVDGFQSTATFKELNVAYTSKEVFLVSAVPPPIGPAAPDYSKAYTDISAVSICKSYGATVASRQQVQKAIEMGAKWCLAGWLSDGTAASVCTAPRITGGTGGTGGTGAAAPAGISGNSAITPFTGPKAYATCWGVKPPENTDQFIQPFNTTRYNMITDQILRNVMYGETKPDGSPNDIFPVVFTRAQAYYALDQKAHNASDARKWAIDNYRGLNTEITNVSNTEAGAENISGSWLQASATGAKGASCSYMSKVYSDFALQLTCLRSHFQDVSGGVYAAMKMKIESGTMQSLISAACSNETPATSPACARLAQLDYSTYYGTGAPPIIKDLQELNYNLTLREQEIQQAIQTMQSLMGVVGCALPTGGTGTCPGSRGCTGPVGGAQTCPVISVSMDILGTGPKGGPQQFTMNNKIGYNSVESLKLRLQEISPYFTSDAYQAITAQALQGLSEYLRVPPVTTYSDAVTDITQAAKFYREIAKSMPLIQ